MREIGTIKDTNGSKQACWTKMSRQGPKIRSWLNSTVRSTDILKMLKSYLQMQSQPALICFIGQAKVGSQLNSFTNPVIICPTL